MIEDDAAQDAARNADRDAACGKATRARHA